MRPLWCSSAFYNLGSWLEKIAPGAGASVLSSQIMTRTKGIHVAYFSQNTAIVVHAMFKNPFNTNIVEQLVWRVENAPGGHGVQLLAEFQISTGGELDIQTEGKRSDQLA